LFIFHPTTPLFFGALDSDDGGVAALPDFSNHWSISYTAADEYFKRSDALRELWALLRNGDVDGGDSVIVPLTPRMCELIEAHGPCHMKDAMHAGTQVGAESVFLETR
jgi:hypothetical protein